MKKYDFVRWFEMILVYASPIFMAETITKVDTKLIECCIRCIASPICQSFQYGSSNLTCVLQGDILNLPLFKWTRNYSVKQLQKLENEIVQYRASELHKQSTKSDYSYLECQTNVTGMTPSSVKPPGCLQAEVKAVFEACEKGNFEEVKRLICGKLVSANCRNEKGKTAVMMAFWYKQNDIIAFLVQHGSNLSAVDDDNTTVLHYACRGGSIHTVQTLLDNYRSEIDRKNKHGQTPLMYAVIGGQTAIIRMLKDRGADLQITSNYNNTILHVACKNGHVDMVKYILSLEIIDIESKGYWGRTPLLAAACGGHINIFVWLKEKGANLKAVDDKNENILHLASRCGALEMVKHVLSLNIVDIESKGYWGRTPLLAAACGGHINIFVWLKEKGANLKAVDGKNENILHLASRCGALEMVKHVLSLNIVDIESKGKHGRTPLMAAVCRGHIDVYDFLKKKGANPKPVDDDNDNILHIACLCGDLKMVRFIISQKMINIDVRGCFKRTPLLDAVCEGHVLIVKELLEIGADPNIVDEDENNIPHMACFCGDTKMVEYVFSMKTIDIECRGYLGRTPLLTAVCRGHINVVKLLHLRYGASLKVSDHRNFNAIHVACEQGKLEMVKYLVTLKEMVGFERRKNNNNETPLGVAKKKRYVEIVNFLIARGN